MDRVLFIYAHKRANLYIGPDNFIVLSASTKMVKKKKKKKVFFPAAHVLTRSVSAC